MVNPARHPPAGPPLAGGQRRAAGVAVRIGLLLLLVSGVAIAQSRWTAAGDGETAWVVRESAFGEWVVLRFSGSAPALKADVAGRLPRPAVALAGDGRRCVAVLRGEAGWHPVREIVVVPAQVGGVPDGFRESAVLPPLAQSVTPVGVRLEGNGTVVVCAGAVASDGVGVMELKSGRWVPVGDGGGEAASVARLSALPDKGEVLVVGDEVFHAERSGADIVVSIASGGSLVETARMLDIPADSALFALGGQIVAVWEPAGGAMQCASISPLGVEVYRGPVSRDGPLPQREVVTLVAALCSLFASVVVWVLVPVKWRQPISAPEGYSYAEPGRRAAATLIDMLPGFLLVEAVLTAWSWVPADMLGVWPTIAALAVAVVMSGVTEAACGRTLGKWAMGCRTLMPDGTRPTRRRLLARNLVKFVCLPLGLVHLLVPPWKWTNPVSLGTVVAVRDGTSGG